MLSNRQCIYIKWMTIIVAVTILLVSCTDTDKQTNKTNTRQVIVAINQYINHPNLEAVLDGFKDSMEESAVKEGWQVTYRLQVANGDIATANHIARQQTDEKPNLILALATPSAQASVKASKGIPVVFGAITDPVAAGLVESHEHPRGNATGTSDRWPYDKQMQLIQHLLPKARTVGIPFNPGEANSVASMKILRIALTEAGLQWKEVPVSNTSELIPAIRSVIGECDVLFAPADNTVLSGIDAVVKLARSHKIPLFAGDEGSVHKGAVGTYGIDYRELGRATGVIAIRILKGEKPGVIPVAIGSGAKLILNPAEAERQGVKIPQEVLDQAILVKEE